MARKAHEIFGDMLRAWGLGGQGLMPIINKLIREGASEVEIAQEIRNSDVYKQRFAGLIERTKNGFNAMSEADFLSYETTAREVARMAGLSKVAIDRYIHGAVANNVSNVELEKRIMDGWAAVQASDQATKRELERLYGVSDGEYLEFFLNPDQAMDDIMRRWSASQLAGAAQRTGFGDLSKGQAEGLVRQGVDAGQAQQGFSVLARSQELMSTLPGEGGQDISGDEQLAAVFGGNAAASDKVERRREERKAQFEGGGGAAANQSGVVGLK